MNDDWESLSSDVFGLLLSFTAPRDATALCVVCRRWHQMVREKMVWPRGYREQLHVEMMRVESRVVPSSCERRVRIACIGHRDRYARQLIRELSAQRFSRATSVSVMGQYLSEWTEFLFSTEMPSKRSDTDVLLCVVAGEELHLSIEVACMTLFRAQAQNAWPTMAVVLGPPPVGEVCLRTASRFSVGDVTMLMMDRSDACAVQLQRRQIMVAALQLHSQRLQESRSQQEGSRCLLF